jgi:hypothetical protein
MAAFDALERLQKFDWLIQKLHSLRNNFQAEGGLQELQKLHTLQLLQRGEFQLTNGSSSLTESEEDKMELCKNSAEEEEEEEVFNEEEEEEEEEELDEEDEEEEEEVLEEDYDQEHMENEQLMPLALTTSGSVDVKSASPVQSPAGTAAVSSNFRAAAATNAGFSVPLPPPPPPPPLGSQGRRNGFSGHPPPLRFPTGLFPPLPFEALFSEQEMQVGELSIFEKNFLIIILKKY